MSYIIEISWEADVTEEQKTEVESFVRDLNNELNGGALPVSIKAVKIIKEDAAQA